MNVKIESDGTPLGTRVVTEDGRDVTDMLDRVEWEHRAGELPRARLNLAIIPITGPCGASFIGPHGKEVRRIEYTDGSQDVFA